MKNINQTVGLGGVNDPQDVSTVQALLQQQGAKNLKIDGIYGPNTLKAIKEFQKQFLTQPDGIVSPGKKTLEQLNNPTPPSSARPLSIPPDPLPLPPIQPWQNGGDKQQGSARDATRGAVYPQIVTIEMLDAVNPEGRNKQNIEALSYINRYLQEFEISDHQEIAHLLAQMAHESQFKPQAEDTHYRYSGAKAAWGNKYGDLSKVCNSPINSKGKKVYKDKKLVLWCNGEALLNMVYGKKHEGLGNDKEGDGYKYRGRGMIQTTGKANYQKFENYYNNGRSLKDKLYFVENPDLLSTSTEFAFESSFYFWHIHNIGARARAKSATVAKVTKPINGPLKGLDDRIKRFNRVAPLLGVQQVTK
ncbi:peptidoglycan-binding protein [Commensalibacter communis]|uniref:peptidoglycan-binding protein n=1 Tax=Commensalibacter communis TaxID=2972786 RepID=UPI0022FFAD77|nr:peptidoglycan-binding protein [Commensalibacter communis]CAI3937672.1 Chitinase [Commensalibacter communis]CAI3940563.1 Chitinase [Commensalibacter communis]